MSQRYFPAVMEHEGERVEVQVMTGWDRPLQHHFLTVFLAPGELQAREERAARAGGAPEEVEELLYSSLADREASPGGGLALPQIERRMRELGLTSPPTLIEDLRADEAGNAGNVHRWYE